MIKSSAHAGVNLYAVHSSETNEKPALDYDEVVAAAAQHNSSPVCLPLHAACPDRRWVSIPEGAELKLQRLAFYKSLKPVTLTQSEAKRKDGTTLAIFTQFDIVGPPTMRQGSDEGTLLDQGCGL